MTRKHAKEKVCVLSTLEERVCEARAVLVQSWNPRKKTAAFSRGCDVVTWTDEREQSYSLRAVHLSEMLRAKRAYGSFGKAVFTAFPVKDPSGGLFPEHNWTAPTIKCAGSKLVAS